MGAGTQHRLVFVDRLLATLVHLRQGATHDMLACWFDVDRLASANLHGGTVGQELDQPEAEHVCHARPGPVQRLRNAKGTPRTLRTRRCLDR
ncbi:transposase family protein [Streptomyces sp. NPDC003758]